LLVFLAQLPEDRHLLVDHVLGMARSSGSVSVVSGREAFGSGRTLVLILY
jgi:hypothetical protein